MTDSTRTFALVVRRELATGGTRTFIYRSTNAAERALDRAAKAGLNAELEFVELVPVAQPTPAIVASLEVGEA